MKTLKLLITFFFFSFTIVVFAQNIYPVSTGLRINGKVKVIEYDSINDVVYVGGHFIGIDGVEANNIAYLKDGVWNSLDSGIDGYVYSIKCVKGKVYVGGYFEKAGGIIVNNIASWDGEKWASLEEGASKDGVVLDIEWYNDELYVVGTFDEMSGVKNNLAVKWDGSKWKEAGAKLPYHTRGLEIIGERLYAWGYTFPGVRGENHTVSYLEKGKWQRISNFDNLEYSYPYYVCKFNDALYVLTNKNNLFKLSNSEWEKIDVDFVGHRLENIFAINGIFYGVFSDPDESTLIKISFDRKEFDIIGIFPAIHHDHPKINTAKKIKNRIWFGGFFRYAGDEITASLTVLGDNTFTCPGKVVGESYYDAWAYSSGRYVMKYKGDFLIGGSFIFAGNVFAKNIVRYDGENFYPMGNIPGNGVFKFFILNNDLLAYTYERKLYKWTNNKWVIYADGLEGYSVKYRVIDNVLYAVGCCLEIKGNDIEGFAVWNGSAWEQYPANWNMYSDEVEDLAKYRGKLVVIRRSNVYMIQEDGSFNQFGSDTIRFTSIFSVGGRLFGTDRFSRHSGFKEFKENMWETTVLDSNSIDDVYNIIEIEGHLNCIVHNGGWWKENDDGEWNYISYVQPLSFAKIADHKYIATGFFPKTYLNGYDKLALDHLAIIEYEDPEISVSVDNHSICSNEYVAYKTHTNSLDLEYLWDFDGGLPEVYSGKRPFVKYTKPGVYSTILTVTNDEGSKSIIRDSIVVVKENCPNYEKQAKNYDNIWISGYHYSGSDVLGGFDFSNGYAYSTAFKSPFDIGHTGTVISNTEGQLQFFTNGVEIADRNGDLLDNSEGFNDDNFFKEYNPRSFFYYQGLLAMPQSNDKYTLIHMSVHLFKNDNTWRFYPIGLFYSTIDMRKNGGLGQMIEKKQIIIDDTLHYSTLQAAPHCNGVDWWVIVGEYNSSKYYRIKLDSSGISDIKILDWGVSFRDKFYGQSVFSPDGNRFALVMEERDTVYTWEFDRCKGELFDLVKIPINGIDEYEKNIGCGFSPNSRFLYVSSGKYLRQFDFCSDDVINSEEVVAEWDGQMDWIYPVDFGRQRLGSDNRLYISSSYSGGFYSVLNNPDQKGLDCDMYQHSIKFLTVSNNIGNAIPEYPHYRIGRQLKGRCDSLTTSLTEVDEIIKYFSVFPNPANEFIHVLFDYPFDKECSISISDLQGRLISRTNVLQHSMRIDIGNLANGIYVCTLESNGKTLDSRKLSVIR